MNISKAMLLVKKSEYPPIVFWLMGWPLKGSPGLKDWVQFPELESISQTQHTRESVKKN